MRDKVFKHTGNIDTVGYFGWQGENKHSLFWGLKEGYKNCGDLLVSTCLEDGTPGTIDTLIFPLIFNYRHYLEIELKFFYFKCIHKHVKNTHNLVHIFQRLNEDIFKADNDAKEFIDNFNGEYDISIIEFITGLLEELEKFDAKGDVFRYMIDNKQKPYFLGGEFIDILEFKKQIDIVSNFFDTLDYFLELKLYHNEC